MTTTFTKISIALILATFVFGIFAYFSHTNFFVQEASAAWGGGGSDGGGSDGSGGGDGCGGCESGGGSGGGDNDNTPTPQPLSCAAFTVSPTSLGVGGGEVTVSWNVRNATGARIYSTVGSPVNIDARSGNYSSRANVDRTTTLKLIGKRGAETIDCGTRTITVQKAPQIPECKSFVASPSSLPYTGGNVTLRWSSTHASSASINHGVGNVGGNDSEVVTVPANNSYSPTTRTYVFTVGNAGKSDSCTAKVTVAEKPTPKPLPVCNLSVSSANLPHTGGNVTFSWNTIDATSISFSPSIGVSAGTVDGSKSVAFPANNTHDVVSKTYTLTARNADGKTVNCAKTVNVAAKPPTPTPDVIPVCNDFDSTPAKVYPSGKVTLVWHTTNATKVSINRGIGNVDVDGSLPNITMPAALGSYTFILTAESRDGVTRTCQTVTEVIARPVVEVPGCIDPEATNYNPNATKNDGSCTYPAAIANCDFLNATPVKVYPSGNVTLAWGTTNATSVTSNFKSGTIDADGSLNVTAPATLGNKTYTITANGVSGQKESCTKTIEVIKKPVTEIPGCTDPNATNYNSKATKDDVSCNYPPTPQAPRCDFFNVSDDEVKKGTEVELSWGTTNATDVDINNGIGDVADDGTRKVIINDDIDFVLTARGNDGSSVSCRVDVNVESDGGGGGGGTPLPKCELRASDRSIKSGERVTLEWETRFGRELTIFEGDEGDDEIYNTNDDDDVEEGEIVVRPTKDTTYTLVVERGSRDRECDVDIDVEEDDVTVIEDRDQTPRVAGITLTQVPYTGFEAGPLLTLLFYMLLAAWGLFVAYHFVIRKKEAKLY